MTTFVNRWGRFEWQFNGETDSTWPVNNSNKNNIYFLILQIINKNIYIERTPNVSCLSFFENLRVRVVSRVYVCAS